MQTSIDIKSAVIGGLTAALVVCTIGAVAYVPGQACARFDILAGPGDTFILDTVTGQAWSLQTLPENVIRSAPHSEEEFYDPKIYDGPVPAEGDGQPL
jgi:hypothetical protein